MPCYKEFEKAHQRPFVTVTPGRHPFEVCSFVYLFVVGLVGAILKPPGSSVVAAFPPWIVTFIYAAAALWSAVGVIGLMQKDQVMRLSIELVACRGMGTVVIGFVITATVVNGGHGFLSSLTGVLWIAAASAWRGYQIRKDLRYLREVRARLEAEVAASPIEEGWGDEDS